VTTTVATITCEESSVTLPRITSAELFWLLALCAKVQRKISPADRVVAQRDSIESITGRNCNCFRTRQLRGPETWTGHSLKALALSGRVRARGIHYGCQGIRRILDAAVRDCAPGNGQFPARSALDGATTPLHRRNSEMHERSPGSGRSSLRSCVPCQNQMGCA
jgi:hypothetical protein